MICMLLYSHEKKELTVFDKLGRELVSRISSDDWTFPGFYDHKKLQAYLSRNPIIDLTCVEVINRDGVEAAELMRKTNREMYMILLTNADVSPTVYIKPTIMPASLLLRPLNTETVKSVFSEAFKDYIMRFGQDDKKALMIETRDGRQRIPFLNILYFESREKKIYINTGSAEFSFYDTLDHLEESLPDDFLRCHRSFIVARRYVRTILLSQNTIVLEDGSAIPLSRTYKAVFKVLDR